MSLAAGYFEEDDNTDSISIKKDRPYVGLSYNLYWYGFQIEFGLCHINGYSDNPNTLFRVGFVNRFEF